MAKDTSFHCSECQQTFQFNKDEKRKHRRQCTYTAADVHYPDLNRRDEKLTMITVYRQEDKFFHCFRCYTQYGHAESFRNHTKECRTVVSVFITEDRSALPAMVLPTPPSSSSDLPAFSDIPTGLGVTPETTPGLPALPSSTGSPTLSSLIPLAPSFHPPPSVFHPPPSLLPPPPSLFSPAALANPPPAVWYTPQASTATSPPPLAIPSTSSSLSLPGPSSVTFNAGHPIQPNPLTPIAPLPMIVQDVGVPLLKALANLARTCPVCWLRGLDNQHALYTCPNAMPRKFATSDDPLFQLFKNLVSCPGNFSYCFGCYLPVNLGIDMNNGRSVKFHGGGRGLKNCRFTDGLLPVLYYVFNQGKLRCMLDRYGIVGYDFATISQIDFARWLVTVAPAGHLPPPLLVLHTMIGEFGVPPTPVSDK